MIILIHDSDPRLGPALPAPLIYIVRPKYDLVSTRVITGGPRRNPTWCCDHRWMCNNGPISFVSEGSAARTFDEGLAGGDHLGDIIDTEGMIFTDIGPDADEWDNYAKSKFYTG